MDEDKQQYLNRWLPDKLSSNVRVVISTIESTVSHQTTRAFKTSPTEIVCGPLDTDARQVGNYISRVIIISQGVKICCIETC